MDYRTFNPDSEAASVLGTTEAEIARLMYGLDRPRTNNPFNPGSAAWEYWDFSWAHCAEREREADAAANWAETADHWEETAAETAAANAAAHCR